MVTTPRRDRALFNFVLELGARGADPQVERIHDAAVVEAHVGHRLFVDVADALL